MTQKEARTPIAETPPADDSSSLEGSNEPAAIAKLSQRFHRYQLLRPLAHGGMGVVYAARLQGSHGLERLVAIKTLRPITSVSARRALLGEARLTARLHHRNVVATIDLGEVDDLPYVVMELVDGVALSRLTTQIGAPLEPNLGAWIIMQAALGLHAAHELTDGGEPEKPLGLVHRDVSPQNILVSLQGEVKIADFGIAKFAGREESTATGLIKGKFAYMSPEQASDADLDRRSDIFALGIVLWETLTGSRLFASDTPARTIMRVLEHKPKPPHQVRPAVSEALSQIAMRCLAKDPAERYETAAMVADAIRGAIRADTSSPPVDETDLAALVKKHFAEERAELMKKLRDSASSVDEGTTKTSAALGDDRHHQAASAPMADATGLSASVSSDAHKATLPQKRSFLPAAALLLMVVAGGGIAWRVASTTPSTTTTAIPPSVSTASEAVPSASASPSPSPSTSASALTTPQPSAAPVVSASSPPPPRKSAPPPPIIRRPAAFSTPAASSPAALPPPPSITPPGAFTVF